MLMGLAATLTMGLSALLVFIYYLKKGQFEDPEDVKYQMFREEAPARPSEQGQEQ